MRKNIQKKTINCGEPRKKIDKKKTKMKKKQGLHVNTRIKKTKKTNNKNKTPIVSKGD